MNRIIQYLKDRRCRVCEAHHEWSVLQAKAAVIEAAADRCIEFWLPSPMEFAEPGAPRLVDLHFQISIVLAPAPLDGNMAEHVAGELRKAVAKLLKAADDLDTLPAEWGC